MQRDPMPACDEDWLAERLTVIDLETLAEKLEKPNRLGIRMLDTTPGAPARLKRIRDMISWMERNHVDQLEDVGATEIERIDFHRNLSRQNEEVERSETHDKEQAARIQALHKAEDQRERKLRKGQSK